MDRMEKIRIRSLCRKDLQKLINTHRQGIKGFYKKKEKFSDLLYRAESDITFYEGELKEMLSVRGRIPGKLSKVAKVFLKKPRIVPDINPGSFRTYEAYEDQLPDC